MKFCKNTAAVSGSRKGNVSGLVFLLVLIIFMYACQAEEKKQSEPLQTTDSSIISTKQQLPDTLSKKLVFPGGDNIQLGCTFVQSQAESLLEEYHRQGTTQERQQTIVVKLEKLNQEWKQMECQQVFGFMIPKIPPSPKGKIQ